MSRESVHIYRRNIAFYHHKVSENTKRPALITLEIESLRLGIGGRWQYLIAGRRDLENLELVHEQGLKSAERQVTTLERIKDYLGLEFTSLTPKLSKSVARPIDQLVSNFEDVRDSLSETTNEAFLND